MRALADDVPVPQVLASCEDRCVTGAAFIVMDHLDALVLRDFDYAVANLGAAERALAGPLLIDAMLALHEVDPARLGLGRLVERRDYVARQLRRWNENLHRVRTPGPTRSAAGTRMAQPAPPQRKTSIVYGDIRIDNCVLDSAAHVLGILDWELATVSGPLADLGQLLVY